MMEQNITIFVYFDVYVRTAVSFWNWIQNPSTDSYRIVDLDIVRYGISVMHKYDWKQSQCL